MKPFPLIIAGSRSFPRFYRGMSAVTLIIDAICRSRFEPTEIVSGCAEGMDTWGEAYAALEELPVAPFEAAWDDLEHPDAVIRKRRDGSLYNANAGPIRNSEMAKHAHPNGGLIAYPKGPWDAKRGGTQHMIRTASRMGLPCYVVTDPYLDIRYGTGHVWLNQPQPNLFDQKEAPPPRQGFHQRRLKDIPS